MSATPGTSSPRRRLPQRMVLVALCTGLGLLCALPATFALMTTRTTMGRPLEVFIHPIDEQTARLAVLFEFETPHGTYMGWSQGNGWWREVADPVLPRDVAQARAAVWRQAFDSPRRTLFRVLYRANDPSGTAFILLETGFADWGQKIGIVLVAFSLLLSLPLPLWGDRRGDRRAERRQLPTRKTPL